MVSHLAAVECVYWEREGKGCASTVRELMVASAAAAVVVVVPGKSADSCSVQAVKYLPTAVLLNLAVLIRSWDWAL